MQFEPSLAEWWEKEVWERAGGAEFHHAVSPDTLLADHPDVIWPGLMLPDTLPLVGNRYGDWLCLRVGADNAISEIIHWYHGGGDWIPWGNSMAEAILFDNARARFPGRRQGHAIDAESRLAIGSENEYFDWAKAWIDACSRSAVRHWQSKQSEDATLANWMLEHNFCAVATRCEMSLAALDGSARQNLSPAIAGELNINWEPDVVSWLFDSQLIPESLIEVVNQRIGADGSTGQAWEAASEHARTVADVRDDLVWAFDIAGWGEERSGRIESAARYYQRGVMALAFADQSIRFRTHWFPQWAGKFSTWRLCVLMDSGKIESNLVDPSVLRYLNAIRPGQDSNAAGEPTSLRAKAMAYWRSVAETAIQNHDWAAAYDAFYRAGWDLGTDTMLDFSDLLTGLVETAQRAGQTARAAVAQVHLNAFTARFG